MPVILIMALGWPWKQKGPFVILSASEGSDSVLARDVSALGILRWRF